MHRLRLTNEAFITKAREIHGDKYNYEDFSYENTKDKINIICKEHGIFSQAVYSHLQGTECPNCPKIRGKKRHTYESFTTAANRVHQNKYSYKTIQFGSSKYRIIAVCKIHGEFNQRGSDHLSGQGCPACGKTGFANNKPGILYLLQSYNTIKIGITNQGMAKRLRQINKATGKEFKILELYKHSDGEYVRSVERIQLERLRGLYASPMEKFSGYTECFESVPNNEVENLKNVLAKCFPSSL